MFRALFWLRFGLKELFSYLLFVRIGSGLDQVVRPSCSTLSAPPQVLEPNRSCQFNPDPKRGRYGGFSIWEACTLFYAFTRVQRGHITARHHITFDAGSEAWRWRAKDESGGVKVLIRMTKRDSSNDLWFIRPSLINPSNVASIWMRERTSA